MLGVKEGASDDEVKKAYYALVRKYHPDKFQAGTKEHAQALEKMKEINAAYDVLTKGGGVAGNTHGTGGTYSGTSQSDAEIFMRVRMLLQLGNMAVAAQLLNSVQNKNAEWHFLMGVLSSRRGWYSQARTYFKQAVDMDPGNSEYRNAYNQFENQGQASGGRQYAGGRINQNQTCQLCACCLGLQLCVGGGSRCGLPLLFCC